MRQIAVEGLSGMIFFREFADFGGISVPVFVSDHDDYRSTFFLLEAGGSFSLEPFAYHMDLSIEKGAGFLQARNGIDYREGLSLHIPPKTKCIVKPTSLTILRTKVFTGIVFSRIIRYQDYCLPIGIGKDKDDNFVIKMSLAAEMKFNPQAHTCLKSVDVYSSLIKVEKGVGIFVLGPDTYLYNPGAEYLVSPGMKHGFINVLEDTILTRTLMSVSS